MTKKEKVKKILEELHKKFGEPKCALNFETPFELLVAVILSAQCTDKRVNIVTEEMFKEVNTPEQFANMEIEEIENYIKSTGFFRNKGYSQEILTESIDKFLNDNKNIKTLKAYILEENLASKKIFENLSFIYDKKEICNDGLEYLIYKKTIII